MYAIYKVIQLKIKIPPSNCELCYFPVTKKVISGMGDGPEFTYVIDRTGGALEQPNGSVSTPQAPIRLRRGISPSLKKPKPKKNNQPATELRMIDFDRDTPIVKKQKTTPCCRHM